MWTGYRKTVVCTTSVIVALVAVSFHFYIKKITLDGTSFKFEGFVDETWTRDLYEILKAGHYDTLYNVK